MNNLEQAIKNRDLIYLDDYTENLTLSELKQLCEIAEENQDQLIILKEYYLRIKDNLLSEYNMNLGNCIKNLELKLTGNNKYVFEMDYQTHNLDNHKMIRINNHNNKQTK